jgi:hypothetical protein
MSATELSSVDSISYAVPTAICVFFAAFMIFSWEHLWPMFRVVLYLGIPLFVYLLTAVVTLLAQYSGCGTVQVGDVFLYSLPSAGLSWIALFVSSFSLFRIPMASVIAPLFAPPPDTLENKDRCCAPSMTLEAIELQSPTVKGFAYGFYLFFATIFGVLISIGFASMC